VTGLNRYDTANRGRCVKSMQCLCQARNGSIERDTHTSLAALEKDLRDWINTWNQNPKPFAWTKTADEILDRLTAYLQRIPGAGR
jgi:hypothetical protein